MDAVYPYSVTYQAPVKIPDKNPVEINVYYKEFFATGFVYDSTSTCYIMIGDDKLEVSGGNGGGGDGKKMLSADLKLA